MARQQHRGWIGFQVGCTYIGTVVGAGFASGQEIYQFFARFGSWAYLGIAIVTCLFAWLGYRMMWFGHRLRAKSYQELNAFLFGSRLGAVADIVLLVMLFGVTVAMIAGAGALVHERLGLSFQIGALVTILVTFLTILRGMDGIMRANTIIVPIMVSFVLYAAWTSWHSSGFAPAAIAGKRLQPVLPILPIISALIYAAFNIGLAAGVLVPLGSGVQDEKALKIGSRIGSIGLGVMLLAVTFTLHTHYPIAMTFSVPMGYVAETIAPVLQWMFVFVLWGEIYSTLVGNVYGVSLHLSLHQPSKTIWVSVGLLLLAYVFSQVGFTAIVKYAYTLFGWMSMMLVTGLIFPRNRLPET